jgi:hypothetical protein
VSASRYWVSHVVVFWMTIDSVAMEEAMGYDSLFGRDAGYHDGNVTSSGWAAIQASSG